MTSIEATLGVFTLFNAFRVLAYVPQIIKIGRDASGAAAVSITAWVMFALSNASTVAYALVVTGDTTLAAIFGVNAALCAAIVVQTALQRRRFRRAQGRPPRALVPAARPKAA